MTRIILLPLVLLMVGLHFIEYFILHLFCKPHCAREVWVQLVAIDRYANTLLGGSAKETISARMGRMVHADKCVLCKITCRLLDIFDKNHCKKATEDEVL